MNNFGLIIELYLVSSWKSKIHFGTFKKHYQLNMMQYQSFLGNMIYKCFLVFSWNDCPNHLAIFTIWSYFCRIIQIFAIKILQYCLYFITISHPIYLIHSYTSIAFVLLIYLLTYHLFFMIVCFKPQSISFYAFQSILG